MYIYFFTHTIPTVTDKKKPRSHRIPGQNLKFSSFKRRNENSLFEIRCAIQGGGEVVSGSRRRGQVNKIAVEGIEKETDTTRQSPLVGAVHMIDYIVLISCDALHHNTPTPFIFLYKLGCQHRSTLIKKKKIFDNK